jgi:hypothetical protein
MLLAFRDDYFRLEPMKKEDEELFLSADERRNKSSSVPSFRERFYFVEAKNKGSTSEALFSPTYGSI